MRPRFVISALAIFLCASAILAVALLGPSIYSSVDLASNEGHTETVKAGQVMGNAIVRENSLTGTTTWKIPTGKAATMQIGVLHCPFGHAGICVGFHLLDRRIRHVSFR